MATKKIGNAEKKAKQNLKGLTASEIKTLKEMSKEAETYQGGSPFWKPVKEGETFQGKILARRDGITSKRFKNQPPHSILNCMTAEGAMNISCQGFILENMITEKNPKPGQLIAVVYKGLQKAKKGNVKKYDYIIK